MENLTDRQEQLIIDLLKTYQYLWCEFSKQNDKKKIYFNGAEFHILNDDYDNVCEIIDYIKGVKK